MASSTAVWKVVANDLPLALVVPDGTTDFEAVANGDNGLPSDGKPNWHIFSRSSRHERCATWYG